jgi:hypothetical protein
VQIDVVPRGELGGGGRTVPGQFELLGPPDLNQVDLFPDLGLCRGHHIFYSDEAGQRFSPYWVI